ncbi:MAG: hypothetical protein ACE366_11245 [Bradymonadia bacterium]
MWCALWLLAGVGLPACESTAFDLSESTSTNLTFSPAFMEGPNQEIEVEATFDGVADPESVEGDLPTWSLDATTHPDLTVLSWSFVSNFKVKLRLSRSAGISPGGHPITLKIENHFGTFVAQGEFFVFP